MAASRQRYHTQSHSPAQWDAASLRELRRHLGLTQDELAHELGVRQQTISEWETGAYAPRGASTRLLGMVAERAGFAYGSAGDAAAPPAEGPATLPAGKPPVRPVQP